MKKERTIYFAQYLLEHVSEMVEEADRPSEELIDCVLRAEIGIDEIEAFHSLFTSSVIRFYDFDDELVYTFYIHDDDHKIDISELVLSFQEEREKRHQKFAEDFKEAWDAKG